MDAADASRRLLRRYIAQESIDLVRAALAVAREEYPDLDEGKYLRLLDRLAEGVQTGLPVSVPETLLAGPPVSYQMLRAELAKATLFELSDRMSTWLMPGARVTVLVQRSSQGDQTD